MSDFQHDFLRKKAMAFLRSAHDDFSRGDYDLVIFHVEQFIQLYLKHLLYVKIGDYPKTHSLTYLARYIIKTYGDEKFKEFFSKHLEIFYLLEEAYLSSKYLPRQYGKEIAERILNFADKITEVFGWLESH